MTFLVKKPGLLSTVQDLGRIGSQSSGFSPAGALDYQSAILANQLVGNDPNTALIDLTLQGISFEVRSDTTIAAAGAPMEIKVNERELAVGRSITLNKGDLVEFGIAKEGLRTYLAVAGGFDVEEVLGSSSTHVRSSIGGYEGRALQAGDVLFANGNEENQFPLAVKEELNLSDEETTLRIVPAPEYDEFTDDSKETLVKESYAIGKDSDRMGIRLDGKTLETTSGAHDILSEPTQLGNVQVPKNGLPIILLNDRQTTGGYKRIATVAKVDIPKVAQLRPGQKINFEMIDLNQATALYKEKMTGLLEKDYLTIDSAHKYYRRTEAERVTQLLMR